MVVENQGDGMFLPKNANLLFPDRVEYDSLLFRHSDACLMKRRIIFVHMGRCFIFCVIRRLDVVLVSFYH